MDATDKGFTGHRHLNDQEVIHIKGRVYDYRLGRFISPDPIIQDPSNSQSLNAYSYIMNNPLAGTDPTGYASVTKTNKPEVINNDGSKPSDNDKFEARIRYVKKTGKFISVTVTSSGGTTTLGADGNYSVIDTAGNKISSGNMDEENIDNAQADQLAGDIFNQSFTGNQVDVAVNNSSKEFHPILEPGGRGSGYSFNFRGKSSSVTKATKKGLGGNPFKGKTPEQIDEAFRKKGFDLKGIDPFAGKGSYINPKTGRKYYIDKGGKYKKGTELPHVDVHRPSSSSLRKKKLPLGDRLIE